MKYKLHPVLNGYKGTLVDASKFIYGYPVGKDLLRLPYGFFVLEDENGEYALIDTGIWDQKELDERRITCFALEKGVKSCLSAIEAVGLPQFDPLKVRTIIITHLHWDHTQGIPHFPNARIYVQKAELAHAIAPYPFEYDSFSMFESTKGQAWLPYILQFEVIEGEKEILPGVRVIPTPGHTAGSQSVLIDTAEGKLLVLGDYAHTRINLEECMPNGILVSLSDWYDTYPKVMELIADGALPIFMHLPETYEHGVYG